MMFAANDNGLDTLERQLDTAGLIMGDVSVSLAEETLLLIAEGFKAGTDPYGNKWAAKKRPDGRAILVGLSAAMRNGWHPSHINPDSFSVQNAQWYSGLHQRGFRTRRKRSGMARVPARKQVPDPGDIPPEYAERFHEVALDIFDEHFNS